MQIQPDGTVKIDRKVNGRVVESKVVKPEDLPNYGISYTEYKTQKDAYESLQSGESKILKDTQDKELAKNQIAAESAKGVLTALQDRGNKEGLNTAISDFNSKIAFGEGGKAVSGVEKSLLSGKLVNQETHNPNILQRTAGFFTGTTPNPTTSVTEDEAGIRQKAIAAILRANPKADVSQYAAASTPDLVQASQEPMSVGGFVKNVGQDVVDMGINAPMSAARNLAGATFEGLRAANLGSQEKDANAQADQLIALSKQIRAEKDPVKRQALIDQSRQVGNQAYKTSQGLEASTSVNDPFVNLPDIPSDPSKSGLQNAGNVLLNTGKQVATEAGATVGLKAGENGVEFDPGLAIRHAYEHPVSTAMIASDAIGRVPGASEAVSGAASKVPVVGKFVPKAALEGEAAAAGSELKVPNLSEAPLKQNAAGEAATAVAVPFKDSVTKSEQAMGLALQQTKSNGIKGLARELETQATALSKPVDDMVKQLSDKIGPSPLDEIASDVSSRIKDNPVVATSPEIALKVDKSLTEALDKGSFVGEGSSATSRGTTLEAINQYRRTLNSQIPSKWFENGMPTTSAADQLNAARWAQSTALRDILAEADQTKFLDRALELQHNAIQVAPAVAQKALSPMQARSLNNLAMRLTGKSMEPAVVAGARALQPEADVLTKQVLNNQLPEITPGNPAEQAMLVDHVSPPEATAPSAPLPKIEGGKASANAKLKRDMRFKQGKPKFTISSSGK